MCPGDSLEPRPAGPAPAPLAPEARERVVSVLTRHYAADRLSDAELQARLDRAYAATSLAELEALTADLPKEEAPAPAPGLEARSVTAFLSGQEQHFSGLVPLRLKLRSVLGYVEVDLTRARFQPGVTEIHVNSIFGYAEIRLPPGVRVESAGHAYVGFFALRGREDVEAGAVAPVVRITGRAICGYAESFLTSRRELPPW